MTVKTSKMAGKIVKRRQIGLEGGHFFSTPCTIFSAILLLENMFLELIQIVHKLEALPNFAIQARSR